MSLAGVVRIVVALRAERYAAATAKKAAAEAAKQVRLWFVCSRCWAPPGIGCVACFIGEAAPQAPGVGSPNGIDKIDVMVQTHTAL
jgi:hypothetical protein